jgi:signal transduction histidine kinase
VPSIACYAEDPNRFRRFRELTSGVRLRRGQGLAGRVFASRKPEWSTDLRGDLLECRAVEAQKLGLGFAMAFPVIVGQQIVGVLEFFSEQVIQPDARLSDAMTSVGMHLGRVIERADFQEHLLTIAEEIQRAIAQDLHDDVGQELTGLGLKAETLAEMLLATETPARRLAADIAAAVERTRGKVRRFSRNMLPPELEQGLLAAALGQLAAATTAGSRIACTFDGPTPHQSFDSRVAIHLFRIAQEAVSNAVRHSGARRIRITLALDHGHGGTELRIEDDGTGIPSGAAHTGSMGLRTMRYRAELIGARLQVGPGPNGGMQVICQLAVNDSQHNTLAGR